MADAEDEESTAIEALVWDDGGILPVDEPDAEDEPVLFECNFLSLPDLFRPPDVFKFDTNVVMSCRRGGDYLLSRIPNSGNFLFFLYL